MSVATSAGIQTPMAITMGDASGIGPEIVLRRHASVAFGPDVVIYGDAAVLAHGASLLGLVTELHVIAKPAEARDGVLNVIDVARMSAADHTPGVLSGTAGAAARDYVERATLDALAGEVAGVVTMPMNKEATQLSDPQFVGHTEFIAQLCGAQKVTMMLTNGPLAVTHVSTHCSLREAIERVQIPRILDVIGLTHRTLSRFLDRPRIAVCGLNPHAGEHGLFGTEDAQHITPAIALACEQGMDVTGPHPADTVFYQAVHRKRYDAIVCMYHDQGHGPMKLLAFDTGVNVTLGLPIIRTSVDHGTAFDIAWTGQAFTDSLDHALAYAWKLAGR